MIKTESCYKHLQTLGVNVEALKQAKPTAQELNELLLGLLRLLNAEQKRGQKNKEKTS